MAVRTRGNSYQVSYRCPGETSPRTETFQSEDEAIIRDMQIKLAKKNGTFEPPVRISKGEVKQIRNITMGDFLAEYVAVYGLKKWGNSFYSANKGLIKNYIEPYIGDRYVRSMTVKDIDAYYTMLLDLTSLRWLYLGIKARVRKFLPTQFHVSTRCSKVPLTRRWYGSILQPTRPSVPHCQSRKRQSALCGQMRRL